jgi:hypothetical protein
VVGSACSSATTVHPELFQRAVADRAPRQEVRILTSASGWNSFHRSETFEQRRQPLIPGRVHVLVWSFTAGTRAVSLSELLGEVDNEDSTACLKRSSGGI